MLFLVHLCFFWAYFVFTEAFRKKSVSKHVAIRIALATMIPVKQKKTCQTGSLLENTGRDPFNQNSNRSDREKWSTSKGGPVFRNFSGWTEPIHWGLDRNFRKFWLKGSRPRSHRRTGVSLLNMETEREKNNRILPPASLRSQKLKKLVCYTKSKKEGQDNEKRRGRCLMLQQPNDRFYETVKRHWTKTSFSRIHLG